MANITEKEYEKGEATFIAGNAVSTPGDIKNKNGEVFAKGFSLAKNNMEQNKDGMWEKKSTDFYNVKILTGNKGLNIGAVASIKKGDPLIVFGNLVKSSYIRQDGTQGTNLDITAQKIGHDLSKGISAFVKFMHTNQNVNQNNQNNQNMQNNQNVNTTNINAPTTTQNNLNNQNANNTTTPPIHTVNGRPVSVASDIKRPVINNNNNNSSLGKLNYQPINSNNMGF